MKPSRNGWRRTDARAPDGRGRSTEIPRPTRPTRRRPWCTFWRPADQTEVRAPAHRYAGARKRVGQTVASPFFGRVPRNVRAPQSRTVGNTHPEQSARKCNREQTASSPRTGGKGETVV